MRDDQDQFEEDDDGVNYEGVKRKNQVRNDVEQESGIELRGEDEMKGQVEGRGQNEMLEL